MGYKNVRKTKRAKTRAKKSAGFLAMLVGAAVCLSATIVYTMPAPEDVSLVPGSVQETLENDDVQTLFGVMNVDVSAKHVSVIDGDKKYSVYLANGTVSDALKNVGVEIGEYDELSVLGNTELSEGMVIEITRVTVQTEEILENIPYETVKQTSTAIAKGKTAVIQEGVNGVRKYSYDYIYKNGEFSEKIFVGSEIVQKPVNKIIATGTGSPGLQQSADSDSGTTSADTSRVLTLSDGIELAYADCYDVVATAYTTEGQTNKITASGATAAVGIIAVDPKVIPLGTKLYIVASDGSWTYGYAVAGDTGGLIKGYRIDLFFNTEKECINFGRQKAKVYILY